MGCFVLLSNVPAAGEMAHRAGDVRHAYKDQHGIEHNSGFLKDPLLVNSLFLKKPSGLKPWGWCSCWRCCGGVWARARSGGHVETTGITLTGGDKKETQKPTAVMRMTKFAALMVSKGGPHRQRAHPLSTVPQQYLLAVGVPATSFTAPQSG